METQNITDVQFEPIQTISTEPLVTGTATIERPEPVVVGTQAAAPTSLATINNDGKPDLSKYSPAEIEKFKQKSVALKVNDATSVLNFGADVQSKIASTSNAFLTNVRAFDAGEIGSSITDLLAEINYIDIDPTSQPAWKRILMQIPGLKNVVINTQKIFQKYDSVSGNIESIVNKLDQGRVTIAKDNNQLEMLFNQNLEQIKGLEELLVIGHLKKEELEEEIRVMRLNTAEYEEYQINDKVEFVNRLAKRLHDIALTRMITIQSLPQIRLVQNNNIVMAEKIQQSIVTTIPIWKQQLAIGVALMRQQNNLKVQQQIYDTTNKILAKNADMLKQNSIDVAKQNERGVVDIATLQANQQKLVETLNEIKQIKEQGEATRREADKVLVQLEQEITKNVLAIDTVSH